MTGGALPWASGGLSSWQNMQVSIIFVESQVLTWQFCSIGPFSDSFIHSFNFLFEFFFLFWCFVFFWLTQFPHMLRFSSWKNISWKTKKSRKKSFPWRDSVIQLLIAIDVFFLFLFYQSLFRTNSLKFTVYFPSSIDWSLKYFFSVFFFYHFHKSFLRFSSKTNVKKSFQKKKKKIETWNSFLWFIKFLLFS